MLYLFNDLAQLKNVPEAVQARIKPTELITLMANGRDVEENNFIMTQDEFNTQQAELAKAQTAQNAVQEMTKKADAGQIAEGLENQAKEEAGG